MESYMKDLFRDWCARHGYKPVRTTDYSSAVGDASLKRRRGLYTIEVAWRESQQTYAARLAGALPGESVKRGLGWEYPLLDASEVKAEYFLMNT